MASDSLSWEEIDASPCSLHGASCSKLENSVVFVGGTETGYLRLLQFDLTKVAWLPTFANSAGLENRSFHAAAVMSNCVYIIGGIGRGSDVFSDVITIRHTAFGLQAKLVCSDPLAKRYGHSLSVMGHARDKLMLFGGSDNSSLCLLKVGHENQPFAVVDVEGEAPPSRLLHSSCVFGASNEFLVVSGGSHNGMPLGDLWIADCSAVLADPEAAAVHAEKGGKGAAAAAAAKKKGAASAGPVVTWTKLATSSSGQECLSRFMHSMTVERIAGSSNECILRIFGGRTTLSELPNSVWRCRIGLSTTGWKILEEFREEFSAEQIENAKSFGPSLSCSWVSNEELSAVVSFGGYNCSEQKSTGLPKLLPTTASTRLLVYKEEDDIVVAIRAELERRERAGKERPKSYKSRKDQKPKEEEEEQFIEKYPNGDEYIGQFTVVNGSKIRHGFGTMAYANGDKYEGNWVHGQRDGAGIMASSDGRIYKGAFCGDACAGDGELSDAENGWRYSGEVQFYLPHGYGTLTYVRSGVTFVGEFKGGKKHGRGVFTVPEKRIPRIPFKLTLHESTDDNTDNHGHVEHDLGDIVIPIGSVNGVWREDAFVEGDANSLSIDCNGHWCEELFSCPMGEIVGQYTGRMEGNAVPQDATGRCDFKDGSSYVGEWRGGRRNGTGKLFYHLTGEEYYGKWFANERCGNGTWKGSNGDTFSGIWQRNLPNGYGTQTSNQGQNRVEGLWRDGRLEAIPMGR